MAGQAIGAYQASGSVGAYQADLGLTLTPAVVGLITASFAPAVVATSLIFLTPGRLELTLSPIAPTAPVGQIISPAVDEAVLAGIAASVVSSTPRSIITTGQWSSLIDFAAGDEWVVTLDGPSATAPRVRVQLLFN